MSEEEKEAIICFALGLISIIIGMYLWNKFPTDARHLFCVYWGGKFIGMGWMRK